VSALEELLGFLSSLPAFSGLSREALTSLAVFVKPLTAQPGQVLALAGQPADALVIIQVGWRFDGKQELSQGLTGCTKQVT
jgi:hypothetical protein